MMMDKVGQDQLPKECEKVLEILRNASWRGGREKGCGRELLIYLEGIMKHKQVDFICSQQSFCFLECVNDFV